MKKLLFVLVSVSLLFISCSEKEKTPTQVAVKDSTINKTKIEAFLSKKGTLYIKDFYNIGSLSSNSRIYGKLEFSAIVIYKPGSIVDSIKGMKVEIFAKEYMTYSSYDKNETAFLDLEELQELSNAIEYMSNLVKKWKDVSREYTELTYETVGNFRLILFPQQKTKDGNDKLYLAVQAGYSKVTCYFENDVELYLQSLKEMIDNGIKKLNNKS